MKKLLLLGNAVPTRLGMLAACHAPGSGTHNQTDMMIMTHGQDSVLGILVSISWFCQQHLDASLVTNIRTDADTDTQHHR